MIKDLFTQHTENVNFINLMVYNIMNDVSILY